MKFAKDAFVGEQSNSVALIGSNGRVWVDMHRIYDPANHTVTATLPHFSIYEPRAGW